MPAGMPQAGPHGELRQGKRGGHARGGPEHIAEGDAQDAAPAEPAPRFRMTVRASNVKPN